MEYQDLLILAESIAKYMEGWRLDRRPVADDHHQGATLLGDKGKALQFYKSYQSKGKITVRGICPDYGLNYQEKRNAYLPHGSDSVNISPTRNPKHIAADIERRLLPVYEAILLKAEEAAQTYQEKVSTLGHIENSLRGISPDLRSHENNIYNTERRFYLYGTEGQPFRSGDIRISAYGGYSCDLVLNDVTLSTAFKIIAILKEDNAG